jgi:hypothetical protein
MSVDGGLPACPIPSKKRRTKPNFLGTEELVQEDVASILGDDEDDERTQFPADETRVRTEE